MGPRDHQPPAHAVEEVTDGDQVAQGEEDEVVGRVLHGDVVDLGQDQRVGEDDGVVEKRLGDHQTGPQQRTAGITGEQRPGQSDESDVGGRRYLDGLGLVDLIEFPAQGLGGFFDLGHRRRGLLLPTVAQQPAGALGGFWRTKRMTTPRGRTEQEGHPPRIGRREMVDHQHGQHRAQQRPAPVGPVHGDIDPAPVPRRYQFVDGRVDGRVLTTDAHSGDEPRDPQPVDPEVGMAEGEPAHEATGQVDGAHREGHFRGRQTERRRGADETGDVAGDGDLETVEDPGHPQGHHHGVEAGPAQPVQRAGMRLRMVPCCRPVPVAPSSGPPSPHVRIRGRSRSQRGHGVPLGRGMTIPRRPPFYADDGRRNRCRPMGWARMSR